MTKQKISWIRPTDLEAIKNSCDLDADGNYLVPETLEIYQKPTKAQILQAEITRLEGELAGMEAPTDAQLIEEGKMMNPYYQNTDMLNYYRSELNKLV